jgi:predicted unusual protein kinase regulating ubiquinone biosynthesis (AarF/ABC1/UbiB family)
MTRQRQGANIQEDRSDAPPERIRVSEEEQKRLDALFAARVQILEDLALSTFQILELERYGSNLPWRWSTWKQRRSIRQQLAEWKARQVTAAGNLRNWMFQRDVIWKEIQQKYGLEKFPNAVYSYDKGSLRLEATGGQ